MNKIKEFGFEDYDEIFSLSQFAFQYTLTEESLAKKKEEAERHKIWGVLDEKRIAAKLHLIPLSVYINGATYDIGGISSVASWPEYRRKGMVKELLFHALNHMKATGQTLSYLHPFSVPFYRRYGWEMAFAEKEYEIPMEKLRRQWDSSGYVKRIGKDIPLLHTIYSRFAKKYNGMLTRDDMWWKQRVLSDENLVAVAYNEQHEPVGYLLYKVKDEVLKVDEIIYFSLHGLKILLQFMANHDSMAKKVEMVAPETDNLPLLFEEPRFTQKISPYFMARIVDVKAFLEKYISDLQLNTSTIILRVEDSFLHGNTGVYAIDTTKGKAEVRYFDSKIIMGIQCSIQQLTAMFLGYRRPMELFELGLIQGDIQEVEKLERVIPNKPTYFPDFF